MINLTAILTAVDQIVGSLEGIRDSSALLSGEKDALEQCIDTLKSISEVISDEHAKRPTYATPFNRPASTDTLGTNDYGSDSPE